jgi:hypothetical protein
MASEIKIDDIVKVRRRAGLWAVLGLLGNSALPGRTWRLQRPGFSPERPGRLRSRRPQGLTVGDGDLTIIAHPTYEPGQIVRYLGIDATVISDDGGSVRISYQLARPRNLDREDRTVTYQEMRSDVLRGHLAAENL